MWLVLHVVFLVLLYVVIHMYNLILMLNASSNHFNGPTSLHPASPVTIIQ